MNRTVPFFRYPHVFEAARQTFLDVFEDVSRRGAFILQGDLLQFEKELAELTGSRYAIGLANATDALELLFEADGILPGDELIFCTHTMVATASAIHRAGGVPVPVEAGPDHLICAVSVGKAITSKTKGVVVTQLNGRCADMARLIALAEEHGIQIYEDSAQALGAKYNGKCAGTFGRGGCISFYPAKLLGCLGDGGALLTNDPEINERVNLIRDHGRDAKTGDVICWGRNSRLDNMQAAFLSFQMRAYSDVIEYRRGLARRYEERLVVSEHVMTPPAPSNDVYFDVFQNYEIEADRRDELAAYLRTRGIGTLVPWGGKAVHHFAALELKASLPFTDRLFERLLMLPMNMSVTIEEVEYVCDCIEKFYA